MNRSHVAAVWVAAAFFIPACPAQAQAQGQGQSQQPAQEKAGERRTQGNVYAGGGIRGAGTAPTDGWLVTDAEVAEFEGATGFDGPLPLRPRALAPAIEVIEPRVNPDAKLRTPFPITVKFQARDDAAIVPSSFRVLYGALKLDITDRITKYAQPTPEGLTFDRAQIPSGKHRLTLQVKDDKQRLAEREIRIEVE